MVLNHKGNKLIVAFIFLFSFSLVIFSCKAENFKRTTNTFGNPGIIDMPIAGSFHDGRLSFTSSNHGQTLRNTLGFQALPRVHGVFRYSGVGKRPMLFIESGYTNWDRSFDLRVDVLKEDFIKPSITIGLQDFIGTGAFSAEYLVASKTIFNKVRLSGGLGWGRLASINTIDDGILSGRSSKSSKLGGALNTDRFFRGPLSAFGGIEYKTPIKDIVIKAEYSSDDYTYDSFLSDYSPSIDNINYGADVPFGKNLNLSAYYVDNEKIGIQLTVSATPAQATGGNFLEKSPEPFYSFPIPEKDLDNSYFESLITELKKDKIQVLSYKVDDNEALVVIQNSRFTASTQAIGRTLRMMSRFIPLNFRKFVVITSEFGIPITKVSLDRNDLEYLIDAPNSDLLSAKISDIRSSPKVIKNTKTNKREYPHFDWSIFPYYRLHLFDPDHPVYYDIGPRVGLSISLKPGFIFNANIEKSFYGDFDEINRGSKGSLPIVRTDIRHYANVLDTRVNDMTLSSYFKYSDNFYGRISAGYFEPMFGGVSNEVLYFNSEKDLSFGFELNYSKKRLPRQLLGFRDLKGMAEINGHFSAYWDTGYYYYLAQLDAGKYLANDNGATVTLTRKFPNGWRVGGFFTLTDASFSEFGEGSFDKGIFMRIPFNSAIPYETKGGVFEKIRPVLGDGGARMEITGRLFHVLEDHSKKQLLNSWPAIWR